MGTLEGERSEEGERVRYQCRIGIAARGRIRAAVAALVIAQQAERTAKIGRLRVTHGKVGGERIAEDEPGRTRGALDLAVEGDAVCLDAHGPSPVVFHPREWPRLRAEEKKSCAEISSQNVTRPNRHQPGARRDAAWR